MDRGKSHAGKAIPVSNAPSAVCSGIRVIGSECDMLCYGTIANTGPKQPSTRPFDSATRRNAPSSSINAGDFAR